VAATIGVGLLGLGTVGSAVAGRLISQWRMLGERAGATPVLRAVAVRDVRRPRDVELPNIDLTDDPFTVVDDPRVQIVVETIGGLDPATSLIERALRQRKTVVTANKAVIATTGPQLWTLARDNGAGLWFEAAVGAGLPVVALLRDSIRGDLISRLDAIINGTTNVVLTRMRESGVPLRTALAEAQQRGFAEADASSDVDGWDAAYKLVIMSWLAFGASLTPDDVDRRGIGDLDVIDCGYAGQLGYSIKLLAHAERRYEPSAIHLGVRPTAIPQGHPLGGVDDSANAVIISSDLAQHVTLAGLGAGGASTAGAVVSDIVNAVLRTGCQPAPPEREGLDLLSNEEVETAAYVRLRTNTDPDAKALIVQAFEDRGIPVADAVERPPIDGPAPQLLVLTGTAPRAVLDRALETVDTLAAVREIACVLDRLEPSA